MTQIRGPFPLPQTSPQIVGVPEVVSLVSGGVYVLPPGNYLVTTGPETLLQWWDPLATTWRVQAAAQSYTDVTSDGANYRLFNMSGSVAPGLSITPGANGTNGIGPVQTNCVVTFAAPTVGVNQALQTAQGYAIIGGTVPAPTVTQAGSGFVQAPLIVCDPPPVGGIQATFTAATGAGGVIAGVGVVNPGAGYTSIPQFYIIPQPLYYSGMPRWPGDSVVQPWPAPGLVHPNNVWAGTIYQNNISSTLGALLTGNALTGSGTLTGINVIYAGGGYPTGTPPTVSFTGTGTPPGSGATTTVLQAPANDTSYLQAKVY